MRAAIGFDGAQLTGDFCVARRFLPGRPKTFARAVCFACEYPKGRLLAFGLALDGRVRLAHRYNGDHGEISPAVAPVRYDRV